MCLVTPSFNLNDTDMLAYFFYYCKQKNTSVKNFLSCLDFYELSVLDIKKDKRYE